MVSDVQRRKCSVHIIRAKAAVVAVVAAVAVAVVVAAAAVAAVAVALSLWPAGLVGAGLLRAYFSIS